MLPSSSSASPTSAIIAAFWPFQSPAMGADIVLHERREQRLRHAEADRAGREIDVVGIFGAGGIALRALVAAKILELLPALAAEQILDGVIDRARMRLHRHAGPAGAARENRARS